jgi:nucleotide-binding universal stress UspA family protein
MTSAPVLVGVDGSDASLSAVDLALREAALRGCPVRIVYADPWANHPAWAHNPPDDLAEPQLAIHAATQRAAASASTAPVTVEILTGDPTPVLIHASRDATLVVVGHRGRGGFPELLLGSVAAKVAAHAACPVIVTRGAPATDGDIVVGVDGTPTNQTAIGFAFAEAALRGTPVHAIHAWAGPTLTGPSDILLGDPTTDRAEQTQLLIDALSSCRQQFPTVAVSHGVASGRPGHALVAAALHRHAQLLVLGPHTHELLPGTRLGSVGHTVLHHAPCPVAIAR